MKKRLLPILCAILCFCLMVAVLFGQPGKSDREPVVIAIIDTGISLSFRRLHDIDKSAWWILIAFVPVVGAIILLVFSLKPGTIGANNYGADPKDTYIG